MPNEIGINWAQLIEEQRHRIRPEPVNVENPLAQAAVDYGVFVDEALNIAAVPAPPQPRRRPLNVQAREAAPGNWINFAPHPVREPEYKKYIPPEKFDMTNRAYYMPYDTTDEVNLRLVGSIIKLHDKPVQIFDCSRHPEGFNLALKFSPHGEIHNHVYKEGSGFDLSPFRSRYIQTNGYAMWTYRQPVRGCYKQGMCSKNTFWNAAGRGPGQVSGARMETFLKAMGTPERIGHVDGGIAALRNLGGGGYSYRLSHFLAIFFEKGNYHVEYKGTRMGTLDAERIANGEVGPKLLHPESSEVTCNMWAIRRLNEVGIHLA